MKKSSGVVTLLSVVVILALGIYTALFGLDENKTGSAANINQGLDLAGGVSITYQVVGDEEPSAENMADTISKLYERAVDYSTESQVYQEGSDRINIEIPGVSDANAILEELGKPGSLQFVTPEGDVVLQGMDVKTAEAVQRTNDMGNTEAGVSLTLTPAGKEAFAKATTAAAVNHDQIYIIYDGEIISWPRVNEPITGGEAYISGMASFEEADKLASTIRIGGLKLELEELRSNVVGAQLGATAITSSLKAGIIGIVVVMLFMVVAYLLAGFASAIALAVYTVLMVLCLNAFNLTLTLPGIAGIILSIGMAVDARALFTRI